MKTDRNQNKTMTELHELETLAGYRVRDFSLLVHALRHSSYCNEYHLKRNNSNERLEFLGDAILEAVSSEYLFKNYPDLTEGEMSRLRASLVCEPTLAFDARVLNLGDFLLLGNGEEATGGRVRDSVVSDACEALIGAIFLDGGFDEAKSFILRFILDDVENKQLFRDSKTALQELVQQNSPNGPVYTLVEESGPDHNKRFLVQVTVEDRVYGIGEGKTKKAAEQNAAYEAIRKLQEQ